VLKKYLKGFVREYGSKGDRKRKEKVLTE